MHALRFCSASCVIILSFSLHIRSETDCSFRVQLDYTAGVLPVCFTDRARDALPADFLTSEKFNEMNVVAKGVYRYR